MQKKNSLRRLYETIRNNVNTRKYENNIAFKWLSSCDQILDVGCGTGNFLEKDPKRIIGVDYNPDCIKVCLSKGLNVMEGNALELPFNDNSFDGVYSAHIMHVFSSEKALKYLSELVRVVKPMGIILINTIPDGKRAYIHAENARPYPPIAVRNMFQRPSMETESAPTLTGLPCDVKQEDIWFRRPPLIDIIGHTNHTMAALGNIFGGIQYLFYLRKYWNFNGYIIKLRNSKKTSHGIRTHSH